MSSIMFFTFIVAVGGAMIDESFYQRDMFERILGMVLIGIGTIGLL